MSDAERPVLAELPAQRLHFADRLETLDDLVEQNLQALEVDRLGQVVVRAFLHRLDGGLDRALRRQQQRRHVGALLLQRAQERQPVHARHHHVGDDDRRPEARDFFERLFAVARRLGDEAPRLDELLEARPRRRIVFDDQHAFLYNSWCVIDSHSHIAGSPYLHASPPPCHFYSLATV